MRISMGRGTLPPPSQASSLRYLGSLVHGLITAVQEALPDLRAQGSMLVTGGASTLFDPKIDAGGGVGCHAAQHKATELLHEQLEAMACTWARSS